MRSSIKAIRLPRKQIGAVLILMAFIIGLGAATYVIKTANITTAKNSQNEKTKLALLEAKLRLIEWSVQRDTEHPGQMPFPDRNNDGNYDGAGDCNSPVSTFSYAFLIGQLPIIRQDNPCIAPQTGVTGSHHDLSGNRFWYAVSRNVVHKYDSPAADPIINPGVISNPTYPWLKVLDANGRIVSDHVVAVIIAPNESVGNQNRGAGVAGPREYLDTLRLNNMTYSNSDYTKPDEDFIQAPASQGLNSFVYEAPYNFNDSLTYITAEELLDAVTHQAALEAKRVVLEYKSNLSRYPDAAILGATQNNFIAVSGSKRGMLPVDVTDTCTCTNSQSCSCSFDIIDKVVFTRGSSTAFNARTGSCTFAGAACTCTGAGSCSRTNRSFTCTALGMCTHNINGATNRYDYTPKSYLKIVSASSGCSVFKLVTLADRARCNGAGVFNLGLNPKPWFAESAWQHYFYYLWETLPILQVGKETGFASLLVSVGVPLTIDGTLQTRPSAQIANYLDSSENADKIVPLQPLPDPLKFDAFNKRHTSQYNDTVFMISK